MSLIDGLKDDWRVHDRLETLSVLHSVGEPSPTVQGYRTTVSVREAADSGGVYQAGDVKFSVPHNQPTLRRPPAIGDAIAASDGTFTVLAAELLPHRTTTRATCRNPVIAENLRDVFEILVGTEYRGDYGAPAIRWTLDKANVAGKIQELSAAAREQLNADQMDSDYAIYLAVSERLTARHRIRHGEKIYAVTGYRDRTTLGALQVVTAKEVVS